MWKTRQMETIICRLLISQSRNIFCIMSLGLQFFRIESEITLISSLCGIEIKNR